jgi:hypothetical protein
MAGVIGAFVKALTGDASERVFQPLCRACHIEMTRQRVSTGEREYLRGPAQ